jgi:hypothetical protein
MIIRMTSDGWADAGGQVIALDEHAAWCLAARESRNPLWHALIVGTSFEKLVAAVAAIYDSSADQLAGDVDRLLATLDDRGLLDT